MNNMKQLCNCDINLLVLKSSFPKLTKYNIETTSNYFDHFFKTECVKEILLKV